MMTTRQQLLRVLKSQGTEFYEQTGMNKLDKSFNLSGNDAEK